MLRSLITTLLLVISSISYAADQQFKDGLKLYLKGEIENAVQIWNQLAQEGDVQSQKQLGQYYLTDHAHRDYPLAISWYRKAYEQGDYGAMQQLENAEAIYSTWQTLANEIGKEAAYATMTFREHLSEGDNTYCGFVVEVKTKVVLVQTATQPRWFKKDNLYAPGIKRCN